MQFQMLRKLIIIGIIIHRKDGFQVAVTDEELKALGIARYDPPLVDSVDVVGNPEYFTVRQVAEIKHVSVSCVYNWMVREAWDELPLLPYVVAYNGRRYVHKKDLDRVWRNGNAGRIRRKDLDGNYMN